ncbi:hypothetical protein B0T16DRAFT_448161 [Cercophora newfieldiana]|uniref:Uncharacterized protein n=1 Tax=Cercophora newfieldiana TaxID=92897 RepID=A0AA39Y4W1_9PEZI|nr:hypothetical protein B0T16DRAFT_448161 [Cercophora newfieldiana]
MAVAADTGSALTSPSRLRKIDVLREKNIGQYVAVETRELCTRYATQITHRRDELKRIDVGIIPGPHAAPEHEKKLKAFHRQFKSNKDLIKKFPALLNEAHEISFFVPRARGVAHPRLSPCSGFA